MILKHSQKVVLVVSREWTTYIPTVLPWQNICQSSHAIMVHYSVCEDSEVSHSRTPIELHQIRFNYCREPSSCMIVGSNKSYHSRKQSIILHENFNKPFATAIGSITSKTEAKNDHLKIKSATLQTTLRVYTCNYAVSALTVVCRVHKLNALVYQILMHIIYGTLISYHAKLISSEERSIVTFCFSQNFHVFYKFFFGFFLLFLSLFH